MATLSDGKIAFFFGAGAEYGMGFPTGSEYTERTMLHKNMELYDALEKFYKARTTEEYSGKYQKQFMFAQNSHTFYEIIKRAVQGVQENCENIDEVDKSTRDLVNKYNDYEKAVKAKEEGTGNKKQVEKVENELKTLVQKAYPLIITNDTKEGENLKKYNELRNYFSYYGSVEKDFASIIRPKEAGTTTFWRLINYFWTAYFAIACPILGIKNPKKQDYCELLNDLQETIKKMYCSNFVSDFICESFYDGLHKAYPDSIAITTNYTPFVEHVWGKESAVYLAGKLSQMEDPMTFEILDLREENENIENRFLFPFMMTQALVKPIVGPEQIEEYGRLAKSLSQAETVVIIGYSLGNADNHINAFIRSFLKKGKRLIYCAYKDNKKTTEESKRKDVLDALRLSKEDAGRDTLTVFCYNGSDDLMSKLRPYLDTELWVDEPSDDAVAAFAASRA